MRSRAAHAARPPCCYASPRSASISSVAVPSGRRISGQSSVGSPASSGGRITPAAMSSSKRLGPPFVFAPGGTSSATIRPCAVIAICSPASIRRMKRLKLSLSSRMPVDVTELIIATCGHINQHAGGRSFHGGVGVWLTRFDAATTVMLRALSRLQRVSKTREDWLDHQNVGAL